MTLRHMMMTCSVASGSVLPFYVLVLDKFLENFEKDFIIHTCDRNKARSQVKLRLRSTCLLETAHMLSESCKLVGS